MLRTQLGLQSDGRISQGGKLSTECLSFFMSKIDSPEVAKLVDTEGLHLEISPTKRGRLLQPVCMLYVIIKVGVATT